MYERYFIKDELGDFHYPLSEQSHYQICSRIYSYNDTIIEKISSSKTSSSKDTFNIDNEILSVIKEKSDDKHHPRIIKKSITIDLELNDFIQKIATKTNNMFIDFINENINLPSLLFTVKTTVIIIKFQKNNEIYRSLEFIVNPEIDHTSINMLKEMGLVYTLNI
jgi:hypothetical protein